MYLFIVPLPLQVVLVCKSEAFLSLAFIKKSLKNYLKVTCMFLKDVGGSNPVLAYFTCSI